MLNFKWKYNDTGFCAMISGGSVLLFFFTKFFLVVLAVITFLWGLSRLFVWDFEDFWPS